ncbi:MAG: toprim domain-containing protein [Bacteroidales bacterium]
MSDYTKDSFATLEWNEHIRQRPGMYIGHIGDGSSPDDGLYVLMKEVIDNAIDEFAMGNGDTIDISIEDDMVSIRDYGRGIPLERVVDAASKMMTGAKFDNETFQKSVGLNGVGLKAVNATSDYFYIESFRNGKSYYASFHAGYLEKEGKNDSVKSEKNGTFVKYHADKEVFKDYIYNMDYISEMLKNYSYLNHGLTLILNGEKFKSENGLLDLVNEHISEEPLYPPIHLIGDDIEIVLTHGNETGEDIASFVNGQNTSQGGTHLSSFREAVAKEIKEFLKKDYDSQDIRHSMVGAISIRVQEPEFDNQTKTKLGSKYVENDVTVHSFVNYFIKDALDNYLHIHTDIAEIIEKKVKDSQRERKAINNIKKATKDKVKKANLCNKKLRDCRIHYCDKKRKELGEKSSIFITEGDSASGSITKIRDVNTQAVFSLKGKPLNCYIKDNKAVYNNEEFILLKTALNIDEDMENLRYNHVIIATDADVDGMHIRLLLLTFFLKYYPELIRLEHLFILQTPLFRVRNKKETLYCYSEEEKEDAIKHFGKNHEITRFKGLGEISHNEFKVFIGEDIKLDPVRISPDDNIPNLLEFYMGTNTPYRQDFIRNNLRSDVITDM